THSAPRSPTSSNASAPARNRSRAAAPSVTRSPRSWRPTARWRADNRSRRTPDALPPPPSPPHPAKLDPLVQRSWRGGQRVRPASLPGQLFQIEVEDLGDGAEGIVEGVQLIQLQIGARVDVPFANPLDHLGMVLHAEQRRPEALLEGRRQILAHREG